MRAAAAVNSKPALLETGKRGRTYPSGRREWPTLSGTRLVCLRSSSARVRGWIGSCLRKRPSMPCKCFATVKGFYFCSAQFCIIINFPLLLLRGREEPTAPSPPTMTSSSHKLVLFWMLRAELAPERSECNARVANSGKLTFLPNFPVECQDEISEWWVNHSDCCLDLGPKDGPPIVAMALPARVLG